MRERFSRAIPAAGKVWREVNLTVSFRSTQAILDAVDAVFFSGDPAADGVALDGTVIHHIAFRSGQGGLVGVAACPPGNRYAGPLETTG